MKQAYNMDETGFTLIELLVVLLTLSIILISVPAVFRGGTQVWEKGDRHAEVLQNALIGMEQITRELRQAKSITSVTNSVDFSDHIEFEYKNDDGTYKYQRYEAADEGTDQYLWHASSDDDTVVLSANQSVLAGPVDSLTFMCYKYENYNLVAVVHDDPEDLARTRMVEIQMSTYDDQGKVNPIPLSSRVYLRGWLVATTANFAIFGNDGVDLQGQPTHIGDIFPSNVGGNGPIYIGKQVEVNGDIYNGMNSELDFNSQTELNGDTYSSDLVILIPCPTLYTPSGALTSIVPVLEGDPPKVIDPGDYGPLYLDDNVEIKLSSGTYYFKSILPTKYIDPVNGGAANNITLSINVEEGDVEVYIGGRVEIGNSLTDSVTTSVKGGSVETGGAERIYFETRHVQDYNAKKNEPGYGAAWEMGQNATWFGTIYAPYGDIDVTDGIIKGQLLSGGSVAVKGGSPAGMPGENWTKVDYVLSNHLNPDHPDNQLDYSCYGDDF